MRYGMVIDLGKCVGCGACAIACKQTNATPPGVWWNTVHQYETDVYPRARLRFLPAACQQCEAPACLEACPTKATSQRPDGIVVVDDNVCVGCGYCTWSCPYGARTLNEARPRPYHPAYGFTPFEEMMYGSHGKGVIEKCNFCVGRVEAGLQPACVATCASGARHFGDLDDATSQVAILAGGGWAKRRLEPHGTRPKVYYLDLDL